MKIRTAIKRDAGFLLKYDNHISEKELYCVISLGRILIAEEEEHPIGWLWWGMFWDNTPFINMLYLLQNYRSRGYGKELVMFWEKRMKEKRYSIAMTSTLSTETAQYFYRKLKYTDVGSLILKREPLEIIFMKELI